MAVVHEVGGRNQLEFPIGKVLYDPGPGGELYYPRFSPKGDRIAFFESKAGAAVAVAVVDRAGKKTTLSRNWGDAAGLAWNPKTGEVWFSARESRAGPGGSFLHAVSLSGRHRVIDAGGRIAVVRDIFRDGRVLLVDTELPSQLMCLPPGAKREVDLSWFDFSEGSGLSADGKTVLLSERGFAGGFRGAAYLRQTDGSGAVRLGEGFPIALSADGKWAACIDLESQDRLVLLPTGAGQSKTLPNERLIYGAYGAAWFPDGKRILFPAYRPGHGAALFVQDLSGGSPRPMTPEGVEAGVVSPDGQYVAARGPGDRVFLYSIDGGEPRAVPEVRPSDELIRWDERGEALFLASGDLPKRIDRLELASGRRTFLRDLAPDDPVGLRFLGGVLMTPDGKSYVYTAYRDFSTLYVVDGLK
jgi:Tol biopolymer transport system component